MAQASLSIGSRSHLLYDLSKAIEVGFDIDFAYRDVGKGREQDAVALKDDESFHVLNPVSPGWACSIPFTEYMIDEVEKLRAR